MHGCVQVSSPQGREPQSALYHSAFCIGAVSVQIAGSCASDVALIPSLQPFQDRTHSPGIQVEITWAFKLTRDSARPLFHSGSVWRLFENEVGFRFDFSTPAFGDRPYKRLLVDRSFRNASLCMSGECQAPGYSIAPLDYPLDELLIMHRLTQERAIELHSCGIVGPDGAGNLFVGHSGAGKSTTTRLWTALEDVDVLSDDRIIVRRDVGMHAGSDAETPFQSGAAANKHQILRLRDCSAEDDKRKKGMRMYGTPWHGEAMYASPNSAPLSRIFILEHGQGNILTPLSPSQAVAELFARSFVPFHRHEYVDSALDFLQELADAVPVYRYSFEPTPQAVDKILDLHD
jgi:hypothetical protein